MPAVAAATPTPSAPGKACLCLLRRCALKPRVFALDLVAGINFSPLSGLIPPSAQASSAVIHPAPIWTIMGAQVPLIWHGHPSGLNRLPLPASERKNPAAE